MKALYILLALVLVFLMNLKTVAQDTNWVKENSWFFDNFSKDTLPWSTFRETFIGVAPSRAADFDRLFYNLIYETKLAGPGLCYGMCVMAMLMMKNGGHFGYCHPPYMYSGRIAPPPNDTIGPSDPNLQTAIQIVHGYQINHGFLSFLLDIFAMTNNRDGHYAYDQVDYFLAKNDPPIISITKTLVPEPPPDGGGHVLIPYFVKNNRDSPTKKIYVYDVNHSFYEPGTHGHGYYIAQNNFIEITKSSGAWKYSSLGYSGRPPARPGDAGDGGNLLVIPLSVAGKKDRLPQSLLADGSLAINEIFIFGDVKIKQISDPLRKRQYLNDDGTDVEPCEEKRLNNIMPFIPMGESSPIKSSVKNIIYFFGGTNPVDVIYRAYGDYRIGMIFRGRYFEVKGKGTGNVQHFNIKNFLKQKKQIRKAVLPHSKMLLRKMD